MTENQVKKVHAFGDDVLGKLDGVALAEHIAKGELTTAEVIEAAVQRAEKLNPKLNAIVTNMVDTARTQARSNQTGMLAGVPTFIKDTDDVAGVPTFLGSRGMPNNPAAESSDFVKQFQSTGMIALGKTNLPEFGLINTTESLAHGAACNPWNLGHSTGGSSGGSAALVAAGVVPIAHANDGGGSIRIPAAACGLVGLKSSRSRLVDFPGADEGPLNIGVHGVVTRTVRDTATFFAAAEQHFHNPKLPKIGHVTGPSKQRLRIKWFSHAPHAVASPDADVLELLEKTVELCQSLGHQVEKIEFPYPAHIADDFMQFWALQAFFIYWRGRQLFNKPDFDAKQIEPWTKSLSRFFFRNILRTPFAIRRLQAFTPEFDTYFADADLLLCPTQYFAAPQLGFLGPDVEFDELRERVIDFTPFTFYLNASGAPAISLPMGLNKEGLPLGMHFAAPMGHEKRLLELAFELEEANPWPKIWE